MRQSYSTHTHTQKKQGNKSNQKKERHLDIYKENFKIFREEENRRWKTVPSSWIGRVSL